MDLSTVEIGETLWHWPTPVMPRQVTVDYRASEHSAKVTNVSKVERYRTSAVTIASYLYRDLEPLIEEMDEIISILKDDRDKLVREYQYAEEEKMAAQEAAQPTVEG